MEKRISYDQFQSVKRVAQACNPLMVKRDKIKAKIEALTAEYCDYDTQISSLEAGIKQVVGFRVEQLVKKVIEPGIDVNGQPKKTTKYLPTDIVSYDEKHKQYVITIDDANKEGGKEEERSEASMEDVPQNVAETIEPSSITSSPSIAATSPIVAPESHNDAVVTDAPIFN